MHGPRFGDRAPRPAPRVPACYARRNRRTGRQGGSRARARPGKLRGMRQIAGPRGIITVTAIDHRGSLEAMLKRALAGPRDRLRRDGGREAPDRAGARAPVDSGAARPAPRRPHPVPRRGPRAGGPHHVPRGVRLRGGGRGAAHRDHPRMERREDQAHGRGRREGAPLLPPRGAGRRAAQQEAFVRARGRGLPPPRHRAAPRADVVSDPAGRPEGERGVRAREARDRDRVGAAARAARRGPPQGGVPRRIPRFETDESRLRAHCRALTAASTVPWVLLSAGETFDTFQRLTGIACQEGASGFMVGRAIWQEAMNLADPAERDRFLATTGASRLRILSALADAHATPWTARFSDAASGPAAREGWHGGLRGVTAARRGPALTPGRGHGENRGGRRRSTPALRRLPMTSRRSFLRTSAAGAAALAGSRLGVGPGSGRGAMVPVEDHGGGREAYERAESRLREGAPGHHAHPGGIVINFPTRGSTTKPSRCSRPRSWPTS